MAFRHLRGEISEINEVSTNEEAALFRGAASETRELLLSSGL